MLRRITRCARQRIRIRPEWPNERQRRALGSPIRRVPIAVGGLLLLLFGRHSCHRCPRHRNELGPSRFRGTPSIRLRSRHRCGQREHDGVRPRVSDQWKINGRVGGITVARGGVLKNCRITETQGDLNIAGLPRGQRNGLVSGWVAATAVREENLWRGLGILPTIGEL